MRSLLAVAMLLTTGCATGRMVNNRPGADYSLDEEECYLEAMLLHPLWNPWHEKNTYLAQNNHVLLCLQAKGWYWTERVAE